jgi:histidyl-tRNA synthetase
MIIKNLNIKYKHQLEIKMMIKKVLLTQTIKKQFHSMILKHHAQKMQTQKDLLRKKDHKKAEIFRYLHLRHLKNKHSCNTKKHLKKISSYLRQNIAIIKVTANMTT